MKMKDCRLMRFRNVVIAGLFLVVGHAHLSNAGPTNISYTPNPLFLGCASTYTVHDNSNWQAIYSWSYRRAGGGPNDWISFGGNTTSVNYIEPKPGSYEVQCEAVYVSQNGVQPPPASAVSVIVTINQANADKVVSGLNVDTIMGSEPDTVRPGQLTVTFQILSGTTPVGPNITGQLQERIRRPSNNEDTGWLNGAAGVLYIESGNIIDIRACGQI